MKRITKIVISLLVVAVIALSVVVLNLTQEVKEVKNLSQENEVNTRLSEDTSKNDSKYASIVNLKASIQHGQLDIILGEDFSISNGNDVDYNAYTEGDTYVVEGSSTNENNITLTVPSDIVFKNVTLKVSGGAMFADNIQTEELVTECSAGALNYVGSIEKEGNINHIFGKTTITLSGQEKDYNYQLEYDKGHINIGNKQYAGLNSSETIDNEADKNINVNSSMGSVSLLFTN